MSISAICLEYSIELSRTAKIESFKYIVQALKKLSNVYFKTFFLECPGADAGPSFRA